MKPRSALAFALLFALLIIPAAYAISSLEAQTVAERYLIAKESTEIMPIKLVDYGKDSYWVVTILSAPDSISVFVPVNAKTGLLAEKEATQRKLFEAAYVLRAVDAIRNSGNPFISSKRASDMDDLGSMLSNQKNQIENSIMKDVNLPNNIISSASSLKAKTSALLELTAAIARKLRDAYSKESAFAQNPSVEAIADLKAGYDAVFEEVSFISETSLAHRQASEQLKNLLLNPELDISEYKAQLYQSYAELPYKYSSIVEFIGDSDSAKRYFEQAFSEASTRGALVDNLKTRIQMANARDALYADDPALREKTGNNYSKLSEAADYMLAQDRKWRWAAQSEVEKLNEFWGKAKSYYEQGKYDFAVEYAEKAKKAVIAIHNGGFSEDVPTLLDTNLVMWIITGLAALLVALFLFSNRRKLQGMLAPKEDEAQSMEEETKEWKNIKW